MNRSQVSRDELDWSTNELRNCLRAIEWDLEDLSETISILDTDLLVTVSHMTVLRQTDSLSLTRILIGEKTPQSRDSFTV